MYLYIRTYNIFCVLRMVFCGCVCECVSRSVGRSVCQTLCLSVTLSIYSSLCKGIYTVVVFSIFSAFSASFFFARIFPGNGNMCWWKIHAVKMTVTQHTAYRTPATTHNTLRRTQRARLHEQEKKTHSLSHIENVSEMLLTCIQTKCQIMPTTIMKFLDLTIHGPGTMGEQPYTNVSSTNHWMNASYWIQDNFWWNL